MKLSFATFLIISLVLGSVLLESSMAMGMADTGDCSTKCGKRCAVAGYKKRCLKYCGICCQKCSCVPSGTSGNKSECPCYNNMLNSEGKSKCP